MHFSVPFYSIKMLNMSAVNYYVLPYGQKTTAWIYSLLVCSKWFLRYFSVCYRVDNTTFKSLPTIWKAGVRHNSPSLPLLFPPVSSAKHPQFPSTALKDHLYKSILQFQTSLTGKFSNLWLLRQQYVLCF